MTPSPENNETVNKPRRPNVMSRVLKFLGLGHTTEEKRQIYEAQFRHPSFRSTIPDSPIDIGNTPDEEAPEN